MQRSTYAEYSADKLEELSSNFLIEHWSISGAQQFAQNEKAFEKEKIYKVYRKNSGLAAHVGDIYHKTLVYFFQQYSQNGKKLNFDELAAFAHDEIDLIKPKKYKLGKTYQTIEAMKIAILETVNFVLQSFCEEVDSYLAEIQEILTIEPNVTMYVRLGEYDCAIPLNFRPDLVFINKAGQLCILDHKAKDSYTEDKEINLRYAYQTIGYTAGGDALVSEIPYVREDSHPLLKTLAAAAKKYPEILKGVALFYFYENKTSANTRGQFKGKPQIRQIEIDISQSRPLYEAMLLEQYLAMEKAVSDPDYVYKLNPADYNQDGEEMIDFWLRSRERGDLAQFENMTQKVRARLEKRKIRAEYVNATKLKQAAAARKIYREKKIAEIDASFVSFSEEFMETQTPEQRIEHRLRCLNLPVKVRHTIAGPSYTTYLVHIPVGTELKRIFRHELDIAQALSAEAVRISPKLQKYEGSTYLSIEVNNEKRGDSPPLSQAIVDGTRIPIGVDNFGNSIFWDYASPTTPHLLVAGTTGSGKTAFEKNLIKLMNSERTRIIVLDPKGIDFAANDPDIDEYFRDVEEIELRLAQLVEEMNRRYRERDLTADRLLVVFDEIADAMLVAKDKSWLTQNLMSLAQKGRAAKITLIACTQRCSVKVISGDIKVNFPARVCFAVPSATDSKVVIDDAGAENLAGKGDGLFVSPEYREPVRFQAFFG